MLCLAAIAAAASSVFAVAPAAAESLHPLIGLCNIQALLLCPATNRVKAGGAIKTTQIGSSKFESGLFTLECTGAIAEGTLASEEAKNMIDDSPEGTSKLLGSIITLFSLTGCKPCSSVKVNGLPLAATIEMTDTGEAAKNWFFKAAGSATFEGCPFGAKCKFGNNEISLRIEMEASGSILNTAGTELKLEEGSELICGGVGKWFAKFSMTYMPPGGSAGPVWFTLLQKDENNPHSLISLCDVQQLLLCPVTNRAEAGGTLKATQVGTGKFEGGLFTEECTGATAEGTLAPNEEKVMIDDALEGVSKLTENTSTAFTFTGCKPCSVSKVNGLPLAATVEMTDTGEAAKNWFLKAAGSATFEGCTFGAKCKFGGKEISMRVEMEASGSILNTAGTELKREEGSEFLCGNSGKWFAKFNTSYTPPGGTTGAVWFTLLKKGEE